MWCERAQWQAYLPASVMEAAWSELETLLTDPDLAQRCRHAAEAVFSLEVGTAAYRALYGAVLAKAAGLSDRSG